MYCKMCGNLLDDTDQVCKICGTKIERKETPTVTEEVVYNPSFEEPAKEESEIEDEIEKFIAEIETPASEDHTDNDKEEKNRMFFAEIPKEEDNFFTFNKAEVEEKIRAESEKEDEAKEEHIKDINSEFAWNIHEFPKPKKTEDIVFEWKTAEEEEAERLAKAAKDAEPGKNEKTTFGDEPDIDLEQQIFSEMNEEAKVNEEETDKFFSFSKKNEEFQRLLDKEYEKLKDRSNNDYPRIDEENRLTIEAEEQPVAIPALFKFEPDIMPEMNIPEQATESETKIPELVIEPEIKTPELVIEPETKTPEPAIAPEIKIPDSIITSGEIKPDATLSLEMYKTKPYNLSFEIEAAADEEVRVEVETTHRPSIHTEKELEEAQQTWTGPKFTIQEKVSQVQEMASARAMLFGEDIVQDNEAIKRKLGNMGATAGAAGVIAEVHADPEASVEQAPIEEIKVEQPPIEAVPVEKPTKAEEKQAEAVPAQKYAPDLNPIIVPWEDVSGEDGKNKKMGGVVKALLVILAIILAAEIAVLGIKYFAPDSKASDYIKKTETAFVGTVADWASSIKNAFAGTDANESKEKTREADAETPKDTQTDVKTPVEEPTADKDALVASQVDKNVNIGSVKANSGLLFNASKNYGIDDLNNSQPILNNIWQTPAGADAVYYDASVVGTVIAFDSQWIDYMNGGSNKVFDLIKKDSKAYQNAITFSKVGKVKENFKLLEIGEIRVGGTGFYVWTHEEISITENGTTSDKNYNWIYYLEPVDGQMQIVNYYKF